MYKFVKGVLSTSIRPTHLFYLKCGNILNYFSHPGKSFWFRDECVTVNAVYVEPETLVTSKTTLTVKYHRVTNLRQNVIWLRNEIAMTIINIGAMQA